MKSRLLSLLQFWVLCTLMVLLPLWFVNGLVWPSLSPAWLLILCAVVGAVITTVIGFVMFGRKPDS